MPAEPRFNDGSPLPRTRRYLDHLADLKLADLDRAVLEWREVMRGDDSSAWFGAERRLSDTTARGPHRYWQTALLEDIANIFMSRPWFTYERTPNDAHVTEPSAQYVTTTAMLALLASDVLAPADFELLYRPMARAIPLAALVGPAKGERESLQREPSVPHEVLDHHPEPGR
jgi:hypothetical protein